ncbi:uncharacterized protein LOC120392542 [Mauremys reevesii]|uniref:uncharacterized protein LOC120392542 n=1 Tax=Mauremys reevesii TaxID=260615 RepID=UPI00193F33E8|nr:uncharacterized protein LOC120392542 [Mauremys reevesii]
MAQASGSPPLPPITAQSYWKQNQPLREHETGEHGVEKSHPAEALAPSSLPRLQESPRAWEDVRVEAGFVDRRGDGEDPSLPADPTIVLPPTAPAPANSTEPQGLRFPASPPGALHPGSLLRPLLRDTEPPLAPVWATLDGGGAVVSNAVRLGLAGLVLCLLVLIAGEYVLSMRNKDTSETDSPPDAATTITTLSTIYVLQEMPIPDASEELYASLSF